MSGTGARRGHLVRRFFGSLSRRAPSRPELDWVRSLLTAAEADLWFRLGPADQRHAVRIALDVSAALGPPDATDARILAGALLHDIGKLDARLGVIGRSAATVWSRVRGEAASRGSGRFARYLRHEAIGAARCAAADSDPLTVALIARSEAAPARVLAALEAADDAI